MKTIKFRQPIFIDGKFDHWHLKGSDMHKQYPAIPTHYTADDGRTTKCKSRLEVKICRYLDLMVRAGEYIAWHYEPEVFEFAERHGITRYKPDFCVIYKETDNRIAKFWIEAKGHLDGSSITKARRFAKYYPDKTIELWMQDVPAGRTRKSAARLAKIDGIRHCFSRIVNTRKLWKGL